MKKNLEFLSKALSLLPEVKETLVPPKEGQFFSKPLGKGDSVTIDFAELAIRRSAVGRFR